MQLTRRSWLGVISAASLAGGVTNQQRLGLYFVAGKHPEQKCRIAAELDLRTVEIYNDDFSPAIENEIRSSVRDYYLHPVALFSMGPGEMVYDFVRGPATIGLVPRAYRAERIAHLKAASDSAERLGIPGIETHCGFIPEDPNDPLYRETVDAVRDVASYCRAKGQRFLYHAGQETAITLMRIIQDVGLDNQGVGLDTANPVMYAKGNPVDSIEIYGRALGLLNLKDGLFPSDPRKLGKEVPIGKGKVEFQRLFEKVKQIGYGGPILIEHEIAGEQWITDLRAAKAYLEPLLQAAAIRRE